MLSQEQLQELKKRDLITEDEIKAYTEATEDEKTAFDAIYTELLKEPVKEAVIEVEKPKETEPEKPKDARGRHPIPCDRGENGQPCEKCKAKEAAKASQPSIKEQIGKYKDVKPPSQQATILNPVKPEPAKVDMGKMITGALFLVMIDNTFPPLLLKLFSFVSDDFDKIDIKAAAREVKMSDEQRKDFEPLAKSCVEFVFGYMHPMVGLFMGLSFVYGGNILMLDVDKFKKK